MISKKYSEYKDSQIEWIGEIPIHWECFKLKHVVNEFIAGGTPKSSNDAFWDENNEGIPWVAIGDMTDNDYINSTTKSLTREGFASKNLRILKKGTLIYSIFASLGKTSFLNIDATTNQAILGLITSNRIDDYYLKYYLEALKLLISSFSNENTQENLNSTIVKNMEIAMPNNLEEQQQIANYLDKQTSKIDNVISKNEQLIQLLEEKRITLINQAVTNGLNPNVPMKDSNIGWIGEIPIHWECFKLKHVVNEFIAGGTPKSSNDAFWDENNEGIPWVAIGDMTDNEYINSTAKSITREGLADKNLRILKRGTLIYSIFASLGKTAILNIDATTNQAILGLITSNKIDTHYLKYYLEALKSTISQYSNENTQENLNSNIVKNMEIAIPQSLDEQKKIVEYLNENTSRIDLTLSKIQKNIDLLEEYKTSLIHHVVTGKIDVRGEEI